MAAVDRARSGRASVSGARVHPRRRPTFPLVAAAVLGFAAASYLVLAGTGLGSNLVAADLWFFGDVAHLSPERSGVVRAGVLEAVALALWAGAWGLGALALRRGASYRALLLVGLVWAVPLLAGPPLFSPDVYDYAAIGASVQHGIDPFREGPGVLGDLPAVRGAEPFWRFTPTPYTPPFVALLSGVSRLFGEDLLSVVVALRVIAVAAWAASLPLLRRLAVHSGRDPRRSLWLAWANPLLLLSGLSAVHSDVIVVAFLLSAFVLAARRHPLLAVLCCVLAGDVKVVGLVGVVVIALDSAGRRIGWRSRLRALSSATVLGAVAFALSVQLSGWGWEWLRNLSVPGKAVEALSPTADLAVVLDPAAPPLEQVRAAGFVVAVVICGLLLTRTRRWGAARTCAWLLLVLALLGPAVWPWYLLWPAFLFAAAGVRAERRLVTAASVVLLFGLLPGGRSTLSLFPSPAVHYAVLAVLAAVLLTVLGTAVHGRVAARVAAAAPLPGLVGPSGRDPAAEWPGDRTSRRPRVLVVTPTYDEAENVTRHIEALLARPVRPDVLIVDDGSPDGTAGIVRDLARAHVGRVFLLERTGERGLGRAYAAGFRWAVQRSLWDVVVQMDADGSHDPAAVDDLVTAMAGADLVLGSRYVPGGRTVNWPWRRRVLSRGGNVYARAVLRLPVRDLTGGFKAWRTDLLRLLDLDASKARGFAFQVETTSEALDRGARCVEVPVVFADREAGSSKMRAGIAVEALISVWRMRHHGAVVHADAPNVTADPAVVEAAPAPSAAQKAVRHSRERSSAT